VALEHIKFGQKVNVMKYEVQDIRRDILKLLQQKVLNFNSLGLFFDCILLKGHSGSNDQCGMFFIFNCKLIMLKQLS
jgi:hypothetical protein